jgi:hypothetical protein
VVRFKVFDRQDVKIAKILGVEGIFSSGIISR